VVGFSRAGFCTFELIPHRLFVALRSSFKRFRSCFCDCIHPQSPSIHYTSDQTLPLTKHHKTQPDLTPTTSSSSTHQPTNATHPPTMCFHKYTHYLKCTTHVPLHTHMCPKNVAEDISRVIFCENYRAIRVNANEVCPFCSPADKAKSPGAGRRAGGSQEAYPSPARTVTP
jgi:hypothetical protein